MREAVRERGVRRWVAPHEDAAQAGSLRSRPCARPWLTARLWGVILAVALLFAPVTHRTLADQPPLSPTVYLPLVQQDAPACPTASARQYVTIPVPPPVSDRPAAEHADLNLALRGAAWTGAPLTLVDYGGDTDPAAPQLAAIFADLRTPAFVSAWRVHEWDWGCGELGCRGPVIAWPPATLLGMGTAPGEPLSIPSRGPEIYSGAYTALVLYAEDHRLTLKYTREDNVVFGYTVHMEELCVDPNLLAAYRAADRAGRGYLPGIRNGQVVGTAWGRQVRVAVRDVGAFMDPRSRKDWWQ